MNHNIYAILQERFLSSHHSVAIQTADRAYTWQAIDAGSAKLAHLLSALGVRAGERVAVQVEKSPEALMLYLATVRLGAIFLPLNTAYTPAEMQYFLENAEPYCVVCAPEKLEILQQSCGQLPIAQWQTLGAQTEGTLWSAAQTFPDEFATVPVAPDTVAAILYTSGTTGRSKGAMLTHQNLSSNAKTLHAYWGWSSEDVLLHMLPIFHIHGLFVACHAALYAGAQMRWYAKFDTETCLQVLPECTVMMGVPTFYVRLLTEKRFDASICRHMRLFISGSAPLLSETFQAFKERTGHTILERYGMSETVMNTSNPYRTEDGERLAGTVGLPLPGIQVRVMDGQGQPCAVNAVGAIQVKGPNVFSGYWRMPEKTKEEFTADGWFITGDMGKWGGENIPDTYVSIVGRSKDLIISGGYNIYPKEIEEVIDQLEGVEESAVIGLPHTDFGEGVAAVVVPRVGSTVDTQQLAQALKQQLAGFKQPKAWFIVTELPRNTMGKVQKNQLRLQFADTFQQ